MRACKTFFFPLVVLVIATGSVGPFSAEQAGNKPWARVTEDERAIKIETDKLEAVIPKKNPKQVTLTLSCPIYHSPSSARLCVP